MDWGCNGKRPHPLYEEDMVEKNVGQKRMNQRGYGGGGNRWEPPNLTLQDNVVFRILCPLQKITYLINKRGCVIETLQQHLGVKVHILDTILGLNEHIILISALDHGSEQGQGSDSRDQECFEKHDGNKEGDLKELDKNLSTMQKVLFEVYDHIFGHVEDSSQQIVFRMLVPKNHIVSLLGISTRIGLVSIDQPTGFALATDIIVEVCGDTQSVKKDLVFVSSQLQDNPPLGLPPLFMSHAPVFVVVNDHIRPKREIEDQKRNLGAMQGRNLPLDWPNDRRRKERQDSGEIEIVFRLLCPNDKVGLVMGTGGRTIASLRKDTGAHIVISNMVRIPDERIIIVSAFELPGSALSPARDAMIKLQNMISRQMEGKKDGMVTIRLLVPTKKINCLIGKGRSINEDILRATQADIRLLSKENFPSCASIEEDELVEIMGDSTVACKAFRTVLDILRSNARVSNPVSGSRGVLDDGHSHSSLNAMRDNLVGRMKPKSPCRRGPSITGLHSSSSFGWHSSLDVEGEGKSEGKSLDSIQRAVEVARDAEIVSERIMEKMQTIMETMVGRMKETIVSALQDTRP